LKEDSKDFKIILAQYKFGNMLKYSISNEDKKIINLAYENYMDKLSGDRN